MGTRRLGVFLLLVAAGSVHAQEPIRVGSKRFTESYILGEILARTARGQHKAGLGNTAILVAAREIDVMDLYSTDAKIERYRIAVLADDRGYFPAYHAVLLHRADAPVRYPQAFAEFARLQNSIDSRTMVRLNARAELDKVPFGEVAREYLGGGPAAKRTLRAALFAPDSGRLLAEHLGLVFGSLLVAALIGVPLGVLAAKVGWLAQPVLALTGLVQTIPSLALLAFLIPLTGRIGLWPALIALFLYALLPITRNTHAGLAPVPRGLLQAGTALGLLSKDILYRIELPLARETIMAGVKTSAGGSPRHPTHPPLPRRRRAARAPPAGADPGRTHP